MLQYAAHTHRHCHNFSGGGGGGSGGRGSGGGGHLLTMFKPFKIISTKFPRPVVPKHFWATAPWFHKLIPSAPCPAL
jgi:hypothetical protein